MNIGIIVEWLDTARGGAETSTRQFIDGLLDQGRSLPGGIQLDILTRSQLPPQPGVTVHTIDTPATGRHGKTQQFLDAAEKWVADAKCDLTHTFVPVRGADIYQPRGGTVPETIIRTAATRPNPIARRFKRWMMSLNARQRLVHNRERDWLAGPNPPIVIALSNYVTRQLRNHYHLDDNHIRRIFNGVNPPDIDPVDRARIRNEFNIPRDAVLGLQVCHNFKLKGVHVLIDALARRPNDALHVVVAGNGDQRFWTSRAKRAGLDQTIRFIGPTDNVTALYAAADLLIHPTFYDPCSRVLLEAVACQLPAIATRYDGSTDILQHQSNAYILDEPTGDSLAAAIDAMCDCETRQTMRDNLSPLADEVTMARHVHQVIELYDELA